MSNLFRFRVNLSCSSSKYDMAQRMGEITFSSSQREIYLNCEIMQKTASIMFCLAAMDILRGRAAPS